jgi:hypothetical protein
LQDFPAMTIKELETFLAVLNSEYLVYMDRGRTKMISIINTDHIIAA